MRPLRPFGHGGPTIEWGYNLPLLIGHLEGLASDEEMAGLSPNGPKAKRLAIVEDAISMLNEAMDMGDEER